MSAFLFLLVKVNLAMGMAVILAALLRRPLRAAFGAPIAYAIWLLVPAAGLAVLLPPRAAAPAPVMVVHVPAVPAVSFAPETVIGHIAPSTLRATEELAGHGMATAIAALPPAPAYQWPDAALLIFAAWALGALLMALYFTWLQLRFSAAARRGEAGPAVLGFLRPRIVTPDSFLTHFTPREQAAILTHERVHLARQDARINALAALLRCLCWFNPLIHLGARWLRIDQELACDASVVAESVSRRDYAEALLKSQIVVASLPLGCNWPGSQHPLIERIALLKRKPPGAVRRLAGVSLVMLAAGLSGLGAWAAQPPVPVKLVAAPLPHMVALPVPGEEPVVAPAQTAQAPLVHAKPASGGHAMDASSTIRAERAISMTPARVQMPSTGSIAPPIQSTVAELPPISLALNITGKPSTPSSDIGTKDVVVANTPSGVGDPDKVVCRAPQRFAGSDQFGPEACGHNYEWWKLAMNGKDLAPDGKTLIDLPTVANTPSGVGDPETMVCRAPQHFAGSDRLGPATCGHNWEWLTMALNGKELAADGKTLIDKPTVANPTGEGDPDGVTCRTPKSAMRAPVCETNRFWADLIKNHQTIDKPTVDNPRGEGDPDGVTCRTPKFVWRGPLVEICRTNRFWADVRKNHQMVDENGVVFGRPPTPPYTAFGGIPDATGDIVYAHGYASFPGVYDSGQAWQSSEPNPGGTLPGNTAASTPTFPGYNGGCCGGGGGGGGGGGTPTFGGYTP